MIQLVFKNITSVIFEQKLKIYLDSAHFQFLQFWSLVNVILQVQKQLYFKNLKKLKANKKIILYILYKKSLLKPFFKHVNKTKKYSYRSF